MTSPLARLKVLMGGELALQEAENDAKAQSTHTMQTTSSWSPLDRCGTGYIDPTEYNEVDSQEILKSLLLSDDNLGKPAPQDMLFLPFWTVKNIAFDMAKALNPSKHPATLKVKTNFWKSAWTLYYLRSQFASNPLLMVPSHEAKAFCHEVEVDERNELQKSDIRMLLALPAEILFDNISFPRPRYLGKIRSKYSFDVLQNALITGIEPLGSPGVTEEVPFIIGAASSPEEKAGSQQSTYREQIGRIAATNVEGYPTSIYCQSNPLADAIGQKAYGDEEDDLEAGPVKVDWKARQLAMRKATQSNDKERWCSALRRTQRYLGLRASHHLQTDTRMILNTDEPILDYDSPPRYPLDLDVIFLSVDIEADEQNQDLVTEIGIAMLDTRDIKNVPPRSNGQNWTDKVTGKHFRIAERVHIRNHLFVEGNPEGFNEKFGTSELITLSQAPTRVRECFEPADTTTTAPDEVCLLSKEPRLRNIVLVGHNIKSDIRWLEKIGFDLLSISNLVEVLATENVQKALKHDQRGGTNLARLLVEMELDAWNLHNAGNDAAYTLQSLLAMAVKGLSSTRPVLSLEERVWKAQIKAAEEVQAEWHAWTAAEMKSKDGNAPVPYRSSALRG